MANVMTPRGRPTAPVVSGWPVVWVRAQLIELELRTLLSAEDLARLLQIATGKDAPSRPVIEADIGIRTPGFVAASEAQMNARRWALYRTLIDCVAAGSESAVDRAVKGAMLVLRENDQRLLSAAERIARSNAPKEFQAVESSGRLGEVGVVIGKFAPFYHRERARLYLREVRSLSVKLIEEIMRGDGLYSFSETLEKWQHAVERDVDATNFDRRAERKLLMVLDLHRRVRRSSINLARDGVRKSNKMLTGGGSWDDPKRELTDEMAVLAELVGRSMGGTEIILPDETSGTHALRKRKP